jgi:hypothetical protein
MKAQSSRTEIADVGGRGWGFLRLPGVAISPQQLSQRRESRGGQRCRQSEVLVVKFYQSLPETGDSISCRVFGNSMD